MEGEGLHQVVLRDLAVLNAGNSKQMRHQRTRNGKRAYGRAGLRPIGFKQKNRTTS
jgi:hypothetical protein